MKKILIAVMVAAVLLVTPLLAACNQTEKTDAIPRWGEESYSYNITKADFVERNTFNDEVYVEEPYASGYEINAESKDELVPEDVAGTFTSQIKPSKDESRYTYTTGQVLYVAVQNGRRRGFGLFGGSKGGAGAPYRGGGRCGKPL